MRSRDIRSSDPSLNETIPLRVAQCFSEPRASKAISIRKAPAYAFLRRREPTQRRTNPVPMKAQVVGSGTFWIDDTVTTMTPE